MILPYKGKVSAEHPRRDGYQGLLFNKDPKNADPCSMHFKN